METTRQTILGILRRRKATISDVTGQLGLAPATVRRHLDILARDGHVDVTQVRRQTGRPHHLFSIKRIARERHADCRSIKFTWGRTVFRCQSRIIALIGSFE